MLVKHTADSQTAFEKLHALHKIIIGFVIAITIYLFADIKNITALTRIMIGWDTFSLCMIIMTWITFKITPSYTMRKQSAVQDSSRIVIFIMVIISTIASFLAVLLLLTLKNKQSEAIDIPVAIGGMVFSWFLVHTIFAVRYAHIYYGDHETKPDVPAGGLDFPGDKEPNYFDFAYFAFVLGMTFQVSDVQVTSKHLRKLALLHGILSFGFNTVIVALTINVIAGLNK